MTLDIIDNLLLFIGRAGITFFSVIIMIALLQDMAKVSRLKRNGLWHTRLALVWLLVGMSLDNGLYAILHLTSGFRSLPFATQVQSLLYVFIFSKIIKLYGLWLLYNLFKTSNLGVLGSPEDREKNRRRNVSRK